MIMNLFGSNDTDLNTDSALVLYYAMNGYAVTAGYFIINIVSIFLGIWIMILNYLVMEIMIKNRSVLYTADIFVSSLALADFFLGVVLLYTVSYNLINYQNIIECLLRSAFLILVSVSSGWHLLALALDRYIKIIKPLQYANIFQKQYVISLCIAIWIFAFILALLPTMGWRKDLNSNNNDTLAPICTFFGTLSDGYLILVTILFWVPFIFMFIVYMHIFKVARRHASAIEAQENIGQNTKHRAFENRSWKFTKTISLIVGTYIIMWMPTGLLIMIYLEGHLPGKTMTELGTILSYVGTPGFINSLLNPIIYAFKIAMVKKRFKQVFCCCSKAVRGTTVHHIGRTEATISTRFY